MEVESGPSSSSNPKKISALDDFGSKVEDDYFTSDDFDKATDLLSKKDDKAAIELFKKVVLEKDADTSKVARMKEEAIYKLMGIYIRNNQVNDLKEVFVFIRPFFNDIPKAKTAKIVRTLIDMVGTMKDAVNLQADLCQDAITWCIAEKRSFLKQRIEAKMCALLFLQKKYKEALVLLKKLHREVKKLDDKPLLVEIELVESNVYFALENIPKAKGALTGARANSNSFYCPPLMQAKIDLQAGILCAAEKDFKTAFSYFYEAYEGYNTMTANEVNRAVENAVNCLKYMLLSKIMMQQTSDVYALIHGKAGLKYAGVELESMKAVADAYKDRSIHVLDQVLAKYKASLVDDAIIRGHLEDLKENLLEQNLIRLIEPFSRVEISHIATLINLPRQYVESKLSELILDKKLHGILDQGSGDLLVFEPQEADSTYNNSLKTIKELSSVVDKLNAKTHKLVSQN